jgi:cell division protein FtsZ
MIHFDLPKQKSSIIKVLGVGGGGSNAVNYMFAEDIEGVDFIICNTDAKAIEQSKVPNKIQLGPHLTQGLGAGANPEIGKLATEESLEEIKRILEVNTKMAFVCAGMGGGTGTGGAPIIAKICKDLGILTVGIVTTPFGFEGPRRMAQAEEGIKQLKPYVDTLLVISNDKLRMQFGNLKMKEAFSKADNVLATAARCITDIINSKGHIIVDFADVCTVMKNGGVAILGNAAIAGENRAQRAIEEAICSPLLNDSDITGAKWILININSAEGDDECTMDEMEIISSYLRMQAGEHADVIMGMGYDNTLEDKLGITLIATGFEHKDPFAQKIEVPRAAQLTTLIQPKEEKVVMPLNLEQTTLPVIDFSADAIAPTEALPTTQPETILPSQQSQVITEAEQPTFMPTLVVEPSVDLPAYVPSVHLPQSPVHYELSNEITDSTPIQPVDLIPVVDMPVTSAGSGSLYNNFLAKPSNIYAEANGGAVPPAPIPPVETPQAVPTVSDEPVVEMTLVQKEDQPEAADISTPQASLSPKMSVEEPALQDDSDYQRKLAAERIQKLRNLSFNMNAADPNNEFESVPAYVRRNMELFGNNNLTSVEDFYSKYTVNKDDNNQTNISSINTFLDGKKPD